MSNHNNKISFNQEKVPKVSQSCIIKKEKLVKQNLVLRKFERRKSMDTNIHDNTIAIHTSKISFEVFRAKHAGASHWESNLKDIVLQARKSYVKRYGEVPLLDTSDEGAAIYLARVLYKDENGRSIEEWLSVRFIFTDQLTIEEVHKLLQSTYLKQPLFEVLKEKKSDVTEQIVVISRICGFTKEQDTILSESTESDSQLRHTAYAFALMIEQFRVDYLQKKKRRFILGLFRDELVKKALQKNIGGLFFPSFYFGNKLLPDALRDEFRIDRSIVAYQFPAYFFEAPLFQKVLRQCIEEGMLERELVASHLPEPADIFTIINGGLLPYHALRRLGNLLTSTDIQQKIDSEVPDGPELRVLDLEKWEQEFTLLMGKILPTT